MSENIYIDTPNTNSQTTNSKPIPPKKMADLYAEKTTYRNNTLAIAEVEFDKKNPETEKNKEVLSAQNLEKSINKNKTNILKKINDFLKQIPFNKVVPGAIGISILAGGFIMFQSLSSPTSRIEAQTLDPSIENIIRENERNKILEEQKDQSIQNNLAFLQRASQSFKSMPSGDIVLIDNANNIAATRRTLRQNINLYSTIYIYQELCLLNLDNLRNLGSENNDLRATFFSLFELELRAYEKSKGLEEILNEIDSSLYDSDRNRRLELRAVANETIVDINQTHAEIQIMINRLDELFLTQ